MAELRRSLPLIEDAALRVERSREAAGRAVAAGRAAVLTCPLSGINEGENIGEVLEVIEHPHQMLFRIDYRGKEALIPVHEETLLRIDKKKKQVHVVLPDGLLNLPVSPTFIYAFATCSSSFTFPVRFSTPQFCSSPLMALRKVLNNT